MSKARPIYLVGMMGAGKSTIGPLLARRLGRRFVDSDHEVEARAGISIAEIFDRHGEGRFRALEVEAIDRASREAAVIALGGGAIAAEGRAAELAERGELVWLRIDPEKSLERVGDGAARPLLAGKSKEDQLRTLEALLDRRRASYEVASHVVDAGAPASEVVGEILAGLTEAGVITAAAPGASDGSHAGHGEA